MKSNMEQKTADHSTFGLTQNVLWLDMYPYLNMEDFHHIAQPYLLPQLTE